VGDFHLLFSASFLAHSEKGHEQAPDNMVAAAGSPQKAVAAVVGLGDRDGPDSDIGRQLRYSLHLSKVYRSYNCFFDEPGESAVK
jgi:hypothetical protein